MYTKKLVNKYEQGNTKVFVKYKNRKLYDIEASKYVNMMDIAKLPCNSYVVLERTTGRDVTNMLLINAIANKLLTNPKLFEEYKTQLVTRFLETRK